MFRVAYAIVRNEEDCADAIQEALLRAWRRMDTLRDEKLFDTWLVRILINECYTLLRKRKRPSLPPMPPPPEYAALNDALMALDDSLRLPITLYYVEGFSIDEIASMLKIPSGTVKGRLYRGRQHLKALLNSEEVKP